MRWTTSLLNINKLNLDTFGACPPIGAAVFSVGVRDAHNACIFVMTFRSDVNRVGEHSAGILENLFKCFILL